MTRLTTGTRFGPFVIEGSIARGARRAVYDATHEGRSERVALLVLRDGTAAEVRRFQEDTRRISRLLDPCLPPVVEVGEHEGHSYLATAYVEGTGLGTILREGPPAPAWSAQVVVRLAQALARCHHAGINCHDLTPADIVLASGEPQPRPVLVGFALLSGDSKRLGAGSHPGFLAPEVHQAASAGGWGSATLGPWTDVYALGVTLYYLLVGEPPFGGGDRRQVIADVLQADPPDANALNLNVPPELSQVCRKALAKVPEDRYPSAEAFARELRAAIG